MHGGSIEQGSKGAIASCDSVAEACKISGEADFSPILRNFSENPTRLALTRSYSQVLAIDYNQRGLQTWRDFVDCADLFHSFLKILNIRAIQLSDP